MSTKISVQPDAPPCKHSTLTDERELSARHGKSRSEVQQHKDENEQVSHAQHDSALRQRERPEGRQSDGCHN